ncbi:MAG: YcjX family protein [Alphaproteobacteria bacterium]|jgi:predicted YcjX-like family ATPase|nr:YcjX family protein [Alphaproteobacteria bacterium]
MLLQSPVLRPPDPFTLVDQALDIGRGLMERRIRLGVTGLSDAGKTVFVTALVQALLHPERLHRLRAVAEDRWQTAVLRPQPTQDLPRFPFEDCVATLTRGAWPESTRATAELRVSIRYRPTGLRARVGDRVLHLDLFDYPGEWLLDLGLLDLDYAVWARKALAAAEGDPAAGDFLAMIRDLGPAEEDAAGEPWAIEAARRFTDYLRRRRAREGRASTLGPGRFLLPGELEGSPLLTFAPLPDRPSASALRRLMETRYDAYRTKVVRRFHDRHFARLDRQIVLVDLAGHLAAGSDTVADVSASLDAVLRSLKIGEGWLPRWLAPRIDRVLFAASKADHLPADQHEALAERLRTALDDSLRRTAYTGATLETRTFSALRATHEVEARGRTYVAGRTADGTEEIAHWPGRVAPSAGATGGASGAAGGFAVKPFLPPAELDPYGAWPHIRLDRVIEFLIGDWLT